MEAAFDPLPWVLGVLGAFIGSFLNVCIHRMPAHRSIVHPGSACPDCGAPIRPWHNVPILSWVFLGGRCASCRAAISFRYPLVEGLTAGLFVLAWYRFGGGWDLARALFFLSALIVLFFTDLDERILPDRVTLTGTAAGLGLAFLAGPSPLTAEAQAGAAAVARGGLVALAVAAATAGAAAGAFWLIGFAWRFIRPGVDSAMGAGDIKMMAMIGAFLGPRLTLLTVFLGSLIGTLIFLATRLVVALSPRIATAEAGPLRALNRGLARAGFLVGDRGAGMLDQVPFGSMLAVGAGLALFWGEGMIAAYLKVSLSWGEWVLESFSIAEGA